MSGSSAVLSFTPCLRSLSGRQRSKELQSIEKEACEQDITQYMGQADRLVWELAAPEHPPALPSVWKRPHMLCNVLRMPYRLVRVASRPGKARGRLATRGPPAAWCHSSTRAPAPPPL